MEPSKPGFGDEKRSDNDNRKAQPSVESSKMGPVTPMKKSWKQRWNARQLSKTMTACICLAMIAGTMLVGFSWGGWVTGGTAQKTASTMANDAVVQRLSAICVAQFQQDPAKTEKLAELQSISSYQRGNYVKDQGWSIMPGEEESDTKVATACGKSLAVLE